MKIVIAEKINKAKSNIMAFIRDEKSARGTTDEGWLVYGMIVIGIIVLAIMTTVFDLSFNDIGNFFMDGINGETDQDGLNKWGDSTDGFNRE